MRKLIPFIVLLAIITIPMFSIAGENIFFLHNSVGRYVIEDSDIRGQLEAANSLNDSNLELWEHD